MEDRKDYRDKMLEKIEEKALIALDGIHPSVNCEAAMHASTVLATLLEARATLLREGVVAEIQDEWR